MALLGSQLAGVRLAVVIVRSSIRNLFKEVLLNRTVFGIYVDL